MTPLLLHLLLVSTVKMITVAAASEENKIVLVRKLLGSGFHRDLETTVSIPRSVRTQHGSSDCAFLLFETLPPGVYADPFQVQSMVPFGGPQVLFDRAVNIEAAEFSSKPHELLIFLSMPEKKVDKEASESVFVVTLTIHARYHRASTDPSMSHSVVNILPPGLYFNCSSLGAADTLLAPCDILNSSMCQWNHLAYKSNFPVLQLSVPVGQLKDIPLVVVTTLLVTVTVCAVLVKEIWTLPQQAHNKNS
jgi:hypothetical protein